MTLQPIPSEFSYLRGKFCFLFYQCSLYFLHRKKKVREFPVPSRDGTTKLGWRQETREPFFTVYPPGVLGAGNRGEGNDGGVQGVHRQVVVLRLHLPTANTK
jgi:hypothetical protein